ncbi:P-loop containing nucleoside triphosphate hydrolase protein [Fistulina hepatica ATCC 64428]|uniref:Eukaryotic translation initiation factor 5B n=1 Tax=Fistulina hepatica ATCC 64428 TaxID=1128425 RepID=A0A0D7A288_9AGAR|nr:P-loop containing nucleoside triphosphate hydrolase protein [Fistulina hepatica ATCC 64428]
MAPPPAEEVEASPLAEEDDESGLKVLTKKEKEKLKKEKEKAKKKAQAAAKKAAAAAEAPAPEDEPDEPAAGKSDKKKKKKKKAAAKDEEPTPAPVTSGKKKGGISALKAMMEEKKRLEEEARRREEEERKRIEEEERLAAEEEKRKEEEKLRKREKEKAKRELAKKEGRLLTKKQKEERAAAERRRAALIASGMQIEGLQGGAPTKKPVYGNRKKKGPARDASKDSTPAVSAVSPTPKETSPAPESRPVSPPPAVDEDVKDDWEASSDEEKPAAPAPPPGVKDSWDAISDEEEEPKLPESAAPTKKPAEESEDESSEEDSDSDEDSSEDSPEDSGSEEQMSAAAKMAAKRKAEAVARREKVHQEALAARSKDDLRSPICCILGHVDTGKTKLLDKIRQTNVQEGEAGGITQQIGATYFPVDAIKTKTMVLNKDGSQEYKIPGLLVIDTPGHESFTNLRSRGSSLCNIAILVVDIMHGLEPQTLESLRLLRDRKTPFIVALNKIDRMYGWEATPDGAFQESLAKQSRTVQREFEDRVSKTILAFAEEGLNAVLYYENRNFARNVSIVPTSAITGEGVPDMIMLLVNLTQQRMSDRLMYLSELECTVLEVKVIEGLGTTIDVVLSNGILHEGDRIVVCGLNGPIVTQIRALLTPQPLRELRIKSAYVHHKEVKAALGVKITAPDLEKAIAGSRLLVVGPDDEEEDLRDEVMSDLTSLLNSIDKSGRGVCVQASTLGSLEALLDFLKSSKIPVSGINIGPVHKRDVMRAATMLEKAKELACILCFDVPVDKDAERLAEEMGIRLFKADIIYHLFDAFTAYNNEITEAKRKDAAPQAVWPCRLKIIAAFCKRDPIILGVDILDGSLRVGTPLAVVKADPVAGKREVIELGKITSLEINHKNYDIVKKSQAGGGVAVKIEHAVYQSAKMYGRHFDDKDEVLSHISRQSIDVLKASFKADVSHEEWLLIKALKPVS